MVLAANEMTGGEALARTLQAHGVGPMFGMGGFQLLPFYDAMRRLELQHCLINDERCGAFAADCYTRVTNRVGVCDATLGPGATNLVTALVESLNAGTPLVAIVGDSHRGHSWKNMTQESRQLEILRPAVKEVLHLLAVEDPAVDGAKKPKSTSMVIFWIVLMNLIFSFDSILSAMALTKNFWIMAAAIVMSGVAMLYLADHVAEFLRRNRMYEVLGLFILFIVGVMLIGEGGHLAHLQLFTYHVEPYNNDKLTTLLVSIKKNAADAAVDDQT